MRRSRWRARLHHLGRRDDVPAILADSWTFLLTSKAEGTPNVLLETQHLGCPPVTTAAGGAGDAIDPGVTAVYAFTPAEGGPSLVQEGAETIQVGADEFVALEDGYLAAATGQHLVVLDQPVPEDMEGESWVVSVDVTDAAGFVFHDERAVIVHAVPLN